MARKRSCQETIRYLAGCRRRNGADSVTVMRIIIFVNSASRKKAISRFGDPVERLLRLGEPKHVRVVLRHPDLTVPSRVAREGGKREFILTRRGEAGEVAPKPNTGLEPAALNCRKCAAAQAAR
jgi:hypothetical protein